MIWFSGVRDPTIEFNPNVLNLEENGIFRKHIFVNKQTIPIFLTPIVFNIQRVF